MNTEQWKLFYKIFKRYYELKSLRLSINKIDNILENEFKDNKHFIPRSKQLTLEAKNG